MMTNELLPDGGPRYIETPTALPGSADYPLIAEPFNAVSAFLFIIVAVYWLRRVLRNDLRSQILIVAMPILAIGGIGGTLYHGTRASPIFWILDVAPIFGLVCLIGAWLFHRIAIPRLWLGCALLLGTVAQAAAFTTLSAHTAINTSYAALAAFVLVPLAMNLWRDRGLGWGWVLATLSAFTAALFFRMVEGWGPHPLFPMGTHWLWHVFGCLATFTLCAYAYELTVSDAKGSQSRQVGQTDMANPGTSANSTK